MLLSPARSEVSSGLDGLRLLVQVRQPGPTGSGQTWLSGRGIHNWWTLFLRQFGAFLAHKLRIGIVPRLAGSFRRAPDRHCWGDPKVPVRLTIALGMSATA